jgi:hypothetical protein
MSRLVAVIVVASGLISVGCGGEDPPRPPADDMQGSDMEGSDMEGSETDEPNNLEPGLDFAITGRSAPMTANAELKVVEGELPVHVAIMSHTSGTDFVMIDLKFESLEEALGSHDVQLSLPNDGTHFANLSLDDNWYYSQSGELTASVGADGSIEGSFDIDLARGTLGAPNEPVVFAPSDVTTELKGTFSGSWELNCHSRLMGHMAVINGGDYCDEFVLPE